MQRIVLILVGGFCLLAMAQQIKCKSPYRYFIPNFTANWHKATEYCFYLGMQLAIVETPEEHATIVELVKESEVFHNESSMLWLGGSDLGEEGIFYWHATGVRLRYASWRPGQPDDYKGAEDCLMLANIPVKGWLWHANDGQCASSLYFICENAEPGKEIGTF